MTEPNYGIIVGRFQVNDLHDGHMELFREVRARHNRVIVFVGIAPTEITRTNPLDFETRKIMIQAKFPEFTVLPLADMGSDELWSHLLDQRIDEVADYGDVTLYGGRDSFVPHYKGRFKPVELCLHGTTSGTEIRDGLTNIVLESSDFRAGIIHAANNMRPRVFPTVDIIIARESSHPSRPGVFNTNILLAQKPGETRFRFIGGFADPASENYEADAKREAYEETGLDVNSLTYLGSTVIKEWRYAKDPDRIKTLVFFGWTSSAHAKAADDIVNAQWFNVEDITPDLIIPDHQPIFNLLKKFMENKNATVIAG